MGSKAKTLKDDELHHEFFDVLQESEFVNYMTVHRFSFFIYYYEKSVEILSLFAQYNVLLNRL